MTISATIPSVRELNDFHSQVKDIAAFSSFQAAEIRNARKTLLQKSREAHDLRALAAIRSGYYLKVSLSNVTDFIKLPFMTSKSVQVADRLVEIQGLGSYRSDIPKLLKEIYAHRRELPQILASVTIADLGDSQPYVPAGLTPREFFACSTIPALFGHSWSVDLKRPFLDFLGELFQALPPAAFQNLQDHWVSNLLKSYIFSSEIHLFLKLSLGDSILKICRDPPDLSNPSLLITILTEMLSSMQSSLSIFPPEVRILLKKLADTTDDRSQKLTRIEFAFLDCLLVPALRNPKAYGLLPHTYWHESSPALEKLAELFGLILHAGQLQDPVDGIGPEMISAVPLAPFFDLVIDVSDDVLTGPKMLDLLPLLGLHFILLVFSVPDVLLLADLFGKLNKIPAVTKIAEKFPKSEAKLDFFRYELWDFAAFGLKKPKIPEYEVDKPPPMAASAAAEALFKFLSFAEIDSRAPAGYDNFTEYYERNMILWHQYLTEAYLRHLYVIYQDVPPEERSAVLPALEDEIRRHGELITFNTESMTGIALLTRDLTECIDATVGKLGDCWPVFEHCLLADLLRSNPEIGLDLRAKKQQILLSRVVFKEFFAVCIAPFKKVAQDFPVQGVASQLHSFVMQSLSLRDFQAAQKGLDKQDKLLVDNTEKLLDQHCLKTGPSSVRNLFGFPVLFTYAIHSLRKAALLEVPLEAVREIAEAVDLLREMFELETGAPPQEHEFKPLFNYALLSAKLQNLCSFGKYLEHFLGDLPPEPQLLDGRRADALRSFLGRLAWINQVLMSC
jgi:hypothetical protein